MLLTARLASGFPLPRVVWLTAGILSAVCAMLFGAAGAGSVQAEDNPAMKIVRGRVVDASGMPVNDARLCLPVRFEPHRVAEAKTNEAGRFELSFPADWVSPRVGGSDWIIWAYAPGHGITTQSAFTQVRENAEEEIKVKLTPESNIRFKVLAPTGEPLAGALVQPRHYKTQRAYDLVPEEMLPSVGARTSDDGIATLSALQPELLHSVQAISDKFGKQGIRVDRDREQAVREIRLRETGKIEGRLTGGLPEWRRGVRLVFSVDNRDEWSDTDGEARVLTDNDGHFEVPVITSGGPVHAYVRLDPSLPVRPRLNDNLFLQAGETLKLEIPLIPTVTVHGKIQAKDSGKPIANAEISLGYGGYHQSEQVVTDEEGRYEGRVLPGPLRAHVIVLPGGYVQLGEPWAEPHQVPAEAEKFELPTIEVVGTHKLTGRLVGSSDEPLPATQLMAVAGNRRYGFATTDSRGRFTMNVPDGVQTSIEVYTDQRGTEPVTVVEREPLVVRYSRESQAKAADAERELKPDVVLTGRVLSEGKPLAGVALTLMRGIPVEMNVPRSGTSPTRRATGMRREKVGSAVTDAEGQYALTGLKTGEPYQIEVKPPFAAFDPRWHHQSPWGPKLSDDAKYETTLPDIKLLKLTQSLAGRVVDPEGKPVVGATVSAQLRDGHTSIPRMTRSGPTPWTETDQEGRFKLQQLPDEPLAIMAYIRPKSDNRIRFPAKVNAEMNQQDLRIVLDPSLVEEEE